MMRTRHFYVADRFKAGADGYVAVTNRYRGSV